MEPKKLTIMHPDLVNEISTILGVAPIIHWEFNKELKDSDKVNWDRIETLLQEKTEETGDEFKWELSYKEHYLATRADGELFDGDEEKKPT